MKKTVFRNIACTLVICGLALGLGGYVQNMYNASTFNVHDDEDTPH